MPILTGFVGPSYQAISPSAAAERSMNLFPESIESGKGKEPPAQFAPLQMVLLGTPGLATFATAPQSPIRAMLSAGQPLAPTAAPRLFVVAGSNLYEVTSGGVFADRGNVGNDGKPAQLFPNGNQLLVISAGAAYIDNGGAASGTNATAVVFSQSTVNTLDTPAVGTVLWISGSYFDPVLNAAGTTVVIANVAYTVATYSNTKQLILTASAGVQSNAIISYGAVSTTAGSAIVTWVSGPKFYASLQNLPITINGSSYTVQTWNSPTSITLTGAFPSTIAGAGWNPQISAVYGAFLDGYYIALQTASKVFQISAINNGQVWNPLDFAVKEGYPDDIVAVFADHEELWLFGTETIEIWDNTGAATFPFVRNPSGYIHQGIAAPFTAVHIQGRVGWLGGDTRGLPVAFIAQGFIPMRVSTHAIEAIWNTYSTVKDATAYVYQDSGHDFWVLNFPTANATWVYDASERLWHERGWWNGSGFDRHRGNTHAYCFGKHLVGDWSTGAIYNMATSLYDDAGTAIHRVRAAPHVSNEDKRIFYHRFRLDAENSGALNPTLDWSNDAGKTFINARTTTSQAAGADSFGVYDWRRLGKSRDRVFRVTITAAVRVALIQAYLEYTPGTI